MEGIEFEADNYNRQIKTIVTPKKKPWSIRFIMKISGGLIKTDKQATIILVFIAFLFLIISMYNFYAANGTKKKISQEEFLRVQKLMDEQLKNGEN